MKLEHIAGARPGHALYRTQSIQRIIGYLADPKHVRHRLAWDIYQEAAKLYVEKELPALNRLLKETPIPSADATAADVLRATCNRAHEYDVSSDQILRFYDVWGVARVENFAALLSEWMKPDEAAQQRRQIASLKEEIGALRRLVEGVRSETSSLKQLVTDALQKAAHARGAQKRLGDAQGALAEGVTSLTERMGLGDTRLKALEGGAKHLSELVTALRRDSVAASALKTEVRRLEDSAKVAIAAATDATRAALEDAFRNELGAVKGVLEDQIAEVSSKLSGAIEGLGRAGGFSGSSASTRPQALRLGVGLKWSAAEHKLTRKGELLRLLSASFRARGVDPVAAVRLQAAVSANVMPVLIGALGVAALEAYADVVFGGRLVKVHITPTLMEPADLFGRLDEKRQTYRPHHSRLLDAVIATRDVGSAMVVLEGINRGPTESYLVPLLTHRGPIQLFHEAVLPSDDVPSAVEWPRGLRLAATCVAGPTSLPVSPDLWAHAVAIEVAPLEDAQGAGAHAISEFPIDEGIIPEVDVSPESLSGLLGTCPDARNCRATMIRFARCFAALNSNETDLHRAIVETSLVPLISGIMTEEERRTALEAIASELGAEFADGLRELERRLRRSIA